MTEALPGVWFCELCGEVIFSLGPPSRCPSCGAWPQLLVEPLEGPPRILARGQSWPQQVIDGGERAIVQEIDTSELYSRVAVAAQHPLLRSCFRCLQRVEGRHAALLCAIFKVKRPSPALRPDLSSYSDAGLLALVREREDDTIGLYRSQLLLWQGTQLETVYRALMDIEADHNALAERLKGLVG